MRVLGVVAARAAPILASASERYTGSVPPSASPSLTASRLHQPLAQHDDVSSAPDSLPAQEGWAGRAPLLSLAAAIPRAQRPFADLSSNVRP